MRRIFLLLLSVFACAELQALEDMYLILGNVSIGLDTDFSSADYYTSFEFFDFNLQGRTGLGASFTPLKFKGNLDFFKGLASEDDEAIKNNANFGEHNDFNLTFINAHLYYNILRDENLMLGPFLRVNAVSISKIDAFEFTTGVIFSFRGEMEGLDTVLPVFCEFVQFQMGYKYNNEKPEKGRFFAQAGVDLTGFFVGIYKNIAR
ncbi:MAG: hypothetical protein LBG43_11230 [Treponema sp.]|jgi:hypothetical protein|nr:hypothetical protein [Treponema sp.]